MTLADLVMRQIVDLVYASSNLVGHPYGGVVELEDTPDLGSGGLSRAGSSPVTPTTLLFYIEEIHKEMRKRF